MTKRIISIICVLAMCFSTLVFSSPALETPVTSIRRIGDKVTYGDANGDGTVNSRDVILVMRAVLNASDSAFSKEAADCNSDGRINSRDVVIIMKAVLSGDPIEPPEKEQIVCTTRDAFVLFGNGDYTGEGQGIASGWLLDNRGGAAKTGVFDDCGTLADISASDGVALIREFNKITVGRIDLTTFVNVRGDGFSLEFHNADDECLYRLYTDGGWRLEAADGESVVLTESVDPEADHRIEITLDLDAGVSKTAVDDVEYDPVALLLTGDAVNIVNFRFATDGPGTPTATPGRIRAVANYALNDDLSMFGDAGFARKWGGDARRSDGVLILPKGETRRDFEPVGGIVCADTQFILPHGEDFAFGIAGKETAAVTFSSVKGAFYANGVKVYDDFVNDLWYRLRIEADTANASAKIWLNGRVIGTVPFENAVEEINGVFIVNSSDGEIKLDVFDVFEKLINDDYVPEPVRPAGEEDHLVGLNVCPLCRDGSGYGWSALTPYPDLEPVLGYYDEGDPEAADWEIKYLVEHGVDFQAFCWYSPSVDSPIDQSAATLYSPKHLYDGYMYSEYSDMMKYCIVWEAKNGACPRDEQGFLDHYLPFFIENFFKDDRYLVIDNKPVLMIYGIDSLISRVGGIATFTNIIDDIDDALIDMGYDGALVIASAFPQRDYVMMGVDGCAVRDLSQTGSSIEKMKDLIYACSRETEIYTIPTVGVGFNGVASDNKRTSLVSLDEYRELNEWVSKKYVPYAAKESWQKDFVMLSAWDDYGEGTYIMPCEGLNGFGYLDVLRETYTDEKADASLNVVPTAAQKARICHTYPQYRHLLRRQGYVDTAAFDAGSVYVNGLKTDMQLPYEISATGELLIPFDPYIGLDLMLNTFHTWDAAKAELTLRFGGHTVVYTVGSDKYTLDGEEKSLGFKLFDNDGLPLIPIALLCAEVGYDCDVIAGEAHITTPQKEQYDKTFVSPTVFAVEREYQIMFYQTRPAYTWIEVDGREYSDAVCGNMRSAPGMRRITVPQSVLDGAKKYTVCTQNIESREAYYTKTYPVTKREYDFYPVPTDRPARAYMIADAHGDITEPVRAAKAFGDIDFLILNGDITDAADDENSYRTVYAISSALVGGTKPVVYARGNHENRGAAAETFPDNMPVRDGSTYYTFRLGNIWGLVLDFGEDKPDSHPEFGGSVRFHEYRLDETEYIRSVIENAGSEYAAEGVEHRIVVVHVPYMLDLGEQYNIETDIFREWSELLSGTGAELILSAHMHYFSFLRPGDRNFRIDSPCPVVIGSQRSSVYSGGTGFVFGDGKIDVVFNTPDGNTVRRETVTD